MVTFITVDYSDSWADDQHRYHPRQDVQEQQQQQHRHLDLVHQHPSQILQVYLLAKGCSRDLLQLDRKYSVYSHIIKIIKISFEE